MILKLLTGGIDLPKLVGDVRVLQGQMFSTRGVAEHDAWQTYKSLGEIPTRYDSLVERLDAMDNRAEETNAALGDHIAKANTRMTTIENVVSSRALAEDVETLRLKLNRIGWEVERPEDGYCSTVEGKQTLATEVAQLKASNAILHASVDALTKKVEALTAAKLGEVKARKAPAKK